jgi:hypothetical protein
LGAHRKQAHGVAGRTTAASASANRKRRSGSQTPARRRTTRTRTRSSDGARATGADRDGLLRSLFPDGIPAREDVIRAINAWLDEADRLATMR